MVSPRILLVLLVSCEADVFTSPLPTSNNDDAAPLPQGDAFVITPPDDASVIDSSDTAPPPPACDVKSPFGAPQPVGGLGAGPYKEGARLSPEQLTILFASNSNGAIQLYQATRPDPMSAFGNVVSVPGMPNTLPSFAPSTSADRLTMVSIGSPTPIADAKKVGFPRGDVVRPLRPTLPFGDLPRSPAWASAIGVGLPMLRLLGRTMRSR